LPLLKFQPSYILKISHQLLTHWLWICCKYIRHAQCSICCTNYLFLSSANLKNNYSREARKLLAPGRSGGYILYGGVGYSWFLILEIASCHGLAPRVLNWLLVFGNILR